MDKQSPDSSQFINPADEEVERSNGNPEVWSLPEVEDSLSQKKGKNEKTNAMGKSRTWRFEPPEEMQVTESIPLTAEDIESIRQAASEEGFNMGKEEGFSEGFEDGKKEGIEAGTVQGHEEGLATGLEEAKENIETLTQQWKTMIEQLHNPLANVEKNVEEQLLELVMQLTQAVVLQEAKTNPDILMAAISEGIKSLPSQDSQVQILLNPADIILVEEEFGSDYISENGWHILPAPQLDQGSCQIENSTSNIDLSIKSRLKQVLDSFLQDALHHE